MISMTIYKVSIARKIRQGVVAHATKCENRTYRMEVALPLFFRFRFIFHGPELYTKETLMRLSVSFGDAHLCPRDVRENEDHDIVSQGKKLQLSIMRRWCE